MIRAIPAVMSVAVLVFGLAAGSAPRLIPSQPVPERSIATASVEEEPASGSLPAQAPSPGNPRWLAGPIPFSVTRVIDGDTFEARVTIWLGQELITKIRLADIDAPEIRGLCGEEKRRALLSRDALARFLEKTPLRLVEVRPDKYNGRVVARVLDGDNRDISQLMLQAGQAVAYHGGKRNSLCLLPG